MTQPTDASAQRPALYHAPSSYYSMVARLALTEAGVAFEPHLVDIHRRAQQLEPAYVRLNPNMTVPTLVLPDRTLSESRDILEYAFENARQQEHRAWIDRHYSFSVEELTFVWFLSWNPLARMMIPRTLGSIEKKLRDRAVEHPELAPLFLRRAEVFADRHRTFDPHGAAALYEERLAQARALEAALSDGRASLVASGYGPSDVVWTVFLARLRFVRLGAEIEKRPAVARYAEAMARRPSFEQADVWASIDPLKMFHQMFD